MPQQTGKTEKIFPTRNVWGEKQKESEIRPPQNRREPLRHISAVTARSHRPHGRREGRLGGDVAGGDHLSAAGLVDAATRAADREITCAVGNPGGEDWVDPIECVRDRWAFS